MLMEPEVPAAELRNALVQAFKAGDFLQTVYKNTLADRDERNTLAAELASLHNAGEIDIVAGFSALGKGDSSGGPDFFLTRYVFEKALPDINAPVLAVMQCVLDLYRRAGRDMMAGGIINAFVSFCEKDASRPKEVLEAIRNDSAFLDLLAGTLIAGARIDNSHFVGEVVGLASHSDVETRRRAIFALSKIDWPVGSVPPESVYATLEHAAQTETDDELLACVVRTAFSLFQRDMAQETRVLTMMGVALSRGGDATIHGASDVAFYQTKDLTDDAIELLVPYLVRVNPANKGTLDNIDYFLAHLLKGGKPEKAVEIAEKLLLAHSDSLSLTVLDSFMGDVLQDKALLSRVTTRWFLTGEPALCEAIHTMLGRVFGAEVTIEIDQAQLTPATGTRLVFVARKALGYLFLNPVTAASIIVSLMRCTDDERILTELGNHLFDPLLVNYSGKAREYVAQVASTASGKMKDQLERPLKLLETYLEGLRSVGDLPELNPSVAQREAHHRRSARQMAESMKQAEAKSVFLSIIKKSVLLYGRKSINYVYGPNGQSQRTEMPLHSHSIQFEMPRYEQLDPFGLEYSIRVFRAERLRK